MRQIRDFYRNETRQPMVPGAVLLFTAEQLEFKPLGQYQRVGDLGEPKPPFLIIDGQHRLAGLHFYLREPDADRRIEVPCVIFDGKTADFATEMFVVINCTHTRINKSHLVDLYEKIEWGTDPHKKFAAKLVRALYQEAIRRCSTTSTCSAGAASRTCGSTRRRSSARCIGSSSAATPESLHDRRPRLARDRALRLLARRVARGARAFGEAWGDNKRYMVTRDVTLEALVRVAGDAAAKSALARLDDRRPRAPKCYRSWRSSSDSSPGRAARRPSSAATVSTNAFPRAVRSSASRRFATAYGATAVCELT